MDPPGSGTLTLVVEKGPRKEDTVVCRPGGHVRIGRVVRGNTFTIKDSGISQKHISIEAAPGGGAGWALKDLGSSNGTLLNGVWMDPSVPTVLRDGDAIKIGEETVLLVKIAAAEAAEPLPAVAGRRRNPNPRRGCAAVKEEAPPLEDAGGVGPAVGGRRNPRRSCAAVAEEAPPQDAGGMGPAVAGRRRNPNPRRGCAAVAEEAPPQGAGGVARGRKRTDAGGGDDAVDGERADLKVEASIKDSSNNTAAGRGRGRRSGRGRRRGRGVARKDAADSGRLASVFEEPEKADLEAVVDGHSKISKEVKPEVQDSPQISIVDMESMTLDEWFDRMEKYIPKVIQGIADEIISEIKAKAERFKENVANSLDPGQRDMCGG